MNRNKWIGTAWTVVMAVAMMSCGSTKRVANVQPAGSVGIVAHRGYWNCEAGGGARNSVAALKAAQDAGFWGSECDVNMTTDEVLLVFHDSSLGGNRLDSSPYTTFTSHRLENGEPIPTLDAFLTQAEQSTGTRLVLEMKAHNTPAKETRAVELAVQALKEHGMLSPDRVIFISFSLHACREFVRRCPGFTVQYLNSDLTAEDIMANGINGVDLNEGTYMGDPARHDDARARGMSINVWTVNDPARMKDVVATGIDQLTTDEPLKARTVLNEMGVKEAK